MVRNCRGVVYAMMMQRYDVTIVMMICIVNDVFGMAISNFICLIINMLHSLSLTQIILQQLLITNNIINFM